MAEYNIAEKTDVIVGGTDKNKYLYYQLVRSLKEAKRVDIIVSFLMIEKETNARYTSFDEFYP